MRDLTLHRGTPDEGRQQRVKPTERNQERSSEVEWGVYVWEPYPGVTRIDAADNRGRILRSVEIRTEYDWAREVTAMQEWLGDQVPRRRLRLV